MASLAESTALRDDASDFDNPEERIEATTEADGTLGDDEDDEDDDVAPSRRRAVPGQQATSTQDDVDDNGDADDLFGEDDADEKLDTDSAEMLKAQRALDDEEIDSGDDLGRNDRLLDDDMDAMDQAPEEEINIQSSELNRHDVPIGDDGETYLLKVPHFMTIANKPFAPQEFSAPVTDHHSREEASSAFNAYKTALSTIRWRKSPSNPSHWQSNARLLRWSDGSMTLQMASQPSKQYMVLGSQAAPPQLDPPKPTPTAIYSKDPKSKRKFNRTSNYSADRDSFTYIAAIAAEAGILRITNKITTNLSVQPTSEGNEAALIKLQQSLAAAANRNNPLAGDAESAGPQTLGGIGLVNITEDPEAVKKAAENAEKDRERQRRKLRQQEDRARDRADRALGGGGTSTLRGGDVLEDDDELGAGVQRLPRINRKKAAKPKRSRRDEILSDDDEGFGMARRSKEDEYDEDDGFLAPSDEEEEEIDGDDDDDDLDEGINLNAFKSRKRTPTPDDDAEGEPEDDGEANGNQVAGRANGGDSPVARNKRRRVIEDDDDEDE